jgi:hypothetical protein
MDLYVLLRKRAAVTTIRVIFLRKLLLYLILVDREHTRALEMLIGPEISLFGRASDHAISSTIRTYSGLVLYKQNTEFALRGLEISLDSFMNSTIFIFFWSSNFLRDRKIWVEFFLCYKYAKIVPIFICEWNATNSVYRSYGAEKCSLKISIVSNLKFHKKILRRIFS